MAARSEPGTLQTAALAAIDFGTTATGYAYLLRKDAGHVLNIRDINREQQWSGGSEGVQAPTTVLMTPDKQFHSFGFEAELKYEKLTRDHKHAEWYYFRHFKMTLHHKKELKRDMMLKDGSGKCMPAMDIFAAAIRYVKEHLMDKLKDYDITLNDVSWIITVPAIWRDSAKQFMREAAYKAGIPAELVKLAYEPESAAIYCKDLAMKKAEGVDGTFLRAFDPGEKYIVLDCGGGTVDTTAHEVDKLGKLKQLHAATGGPWGGQIVNEAFEEFLCDLVTPKVLQKFQNDRTREWIDLQKIFEKIKRGYNTNRGDVDMKFPESLVTTYKDVTKNDLMDRIKNMPNVQLSEGYLILKPETMDIFFRKATDKINNHIDGLLKQDSLKTISTILLVGGFSESTIVSNAVKNHFKTFRVISPKNGGTAILQGAVMYGCDTNVISVRISPFTYGVHSRSTYDAKRHYQGKPVTFGNRKVADNVFDKHLTIGQSVLVGETGSMRTYMMSNIKRREVFWTVYQSTEPDPVYCDYDNKCTKIGKLILEIPPTIKDDHVRLSLSMSCLGSELEAKVYVIDQNVGQKVEMKAKYDFLDTETLQKGSDFEASFIQ